MADRPPLAARLRAASAAVRDRAAVRRQPVPWVASQPRVRPVVAPLPPVEQTDVPWCSPACYCAVTSVLMLPCGNCRRDRPVTT